MCHAKAITSNSPRSIDSSLAIDEIIPSTKISRSAYEYAHSLLHPSILAHSIRVYLYSRALAASTSSIYYTDPTKRDNLFVGCIFHDIGTTEPHNGAQRFEIEGADAAVTHLSKFGVSEEDQKEVWTMIALHTSPGIVERMGELPALMREALNIEFKGKVEAQGIGSVVELKASVEANYPRLEIEKVLGDAVVKQAVRNPAKAPSGTWPGGMYRSYLEDPAWTGANKAF